MKNLARTTLSSGLVIGLTTLLISWYAYGADKLIVKDAGNVTKFVVTDTGMVGIGTATPNSFAGYTDLTIDSSNKGSIVDLNKSGVRKASFSYGPIGGSIGSMANEDFSLLSNNTRRITIQAAGNVGIGMTTPAAQLHTTGTVRFAGVASCGAGIQSNVNGDLSCIGSSRQIKNVEGDLTPVVALANVMALRPQVGSYKATPDEPEHWFIAEEVAAVDPALVGLRNGEPYIVKMQGIVTDLVAVIQEQQRKIVEALERIETLERTIAR